MAEPMTVKQELRKAMERRHPEAVCLGGICYLRLDSERLAKAEFVTSGGSYSGLRLTVLNRRTGPVDSLTVRFWELPRSAEGTKPDREERTAWDVCQPTVDIDALSEQAEEYFRLFREPDSETG